MALVRVPGSICGESHTLKLLDAQYIGLHKAQVQKLVHSYRKPVLGSASRRHSQLSEVGFRCPAEARTVVATDTPLSDTAAPGQLPFWRL